MIWFYERETEAVWIETRFDDKTGEYVIDVCAVGGPAKSERFRDLHTFDRRIADLTNRFDTEHWNRVAGPPEHATTWRGAV